ncbi:hypothetical protein ADH76_18500 [Enterocloster clostridioformis]|nr:hypothetical protein A4V08_36660 [Lachnoclostridium sp. YL32]NDO30550.1 hypothetical protein [Enterocloster clostridioformis]OXE66015.1 hypothetical protein ADH76_18500 [Enterocloster clostridioformis]
MPKISSLIPEAGCGQSPQKKANCKCLIFDTKKQKECIKNSFVVILKLESIIDNKKVTKSTTKFYISISYQRN